MSGTDAAIADGSSDVVTIVDAADAADANDGATRFCQTVSPAPTFCADFDEPLAANAGAGWDLSYAGVGASLKFETPFLSAPRALHATTSQVNGAYVERAFPMTTQLAVEFDVRFAIVPPDGTQTSPVVLTPPNPPGEDIFWFVDANNSYFQEYNVISASGAAPTPNVWHHITFALTTNGSASTISSTMDGNPRWSSYALPYAWPSPTTATVRLGAARTYAQNNDLFIDNVVVRTQ